MKTYRILMLIALCFFTPMYSGTQQYANPTTTGGGTPNLSSGVTVDDPANNAALACSTSAGVDGQYVYAVWKGDSAIQTARSSNYGVTWGAVTDLIASSGNMCNLTCNSTGQYVYVVGYNSTSIEVKDSADSGATWGSTEIASGQNIGSQPKILTNSTGDKIYVLWRYYDYSGKPDRVYFRGYTGGIWNDAVDLTGATYSSQYINMCCSSDGTKIHVIWWQYDDSYIQHVYTKKSTDSGATWDVSVTDLDNTAYGSGGADIACSADGDIVYALWIHQSGGSSLVRVNKYTTAGGWGTAADLTTVGQSPATQSPRIICSSDGQYVYAIFSYTATYQSIGLRRSVDAGVTWETLTVLNSASNSSYYPYIACSTDGKYVYASWYYYSGDADNGQTKQSADYGANWSVPLSTPAGNFTATLPALSASTTYMTRIITNAAGDRSYAIWNNTSASPATLQTANGTQNCLVVPPNFSP